jgi:hypothetical protein
VIPPSPLRSMHGRAGRKRLEEDADRSSWSEACSRPVKEEEGVEVGEGEEGRSGEGP